LEVNENEDTKPKNIKKRNQNHVKLKPEKENQENIKE